MKMTKTLAKKMLAGDYMDSLSAFASYLTQFDEEDMADALDELDTIVWEVASNMSPAKEEKWLQIYTGLMTAC